MRQILDRLPQNLRVGTPVLVSAAAVGLSAIVVAYGVGGIVQSLLQPSIAAEEADPLKKLADESSQLLDASRKRFDGRSMYTLPPRPTPPVRVVEQVKPVDPPKVDLGPPPVPSTYAGPAPSSVFGDYVFFPTLSDEDKRIKVGETKAGITVIAVSPPYSVRLGYQRGEFDVSLWARIDERILSGKLPASRVNGVVGVATSASASSNGTAGVTAGGSRTPAVPAGSSSPAGGRAVPGSASPNASPIVQPPAPGAVADPASTGTPAVDPGELPSAAMKPQRFAPPAGSGEDAPPPEYVDRALLPGPLSESQIAAMSLEQARQAMEAINATDSWVVDDHSRARLDHERELLRVRLHRNP